MTEEYGAGDLLRLLFLLAGHSPLTDLIYVIVSRIALFIEMRRTFALIIPILLLAVLSVGLVSPVFAVKGSYPGVNGKIAFVDSDPDPPYDSEIFVMDNDGTNIQQLTHNDLYDVYPCWSPDGTKIAYESGNPDIGVSFRIWVMDADGSNPRELTTPPTGYLDEEPAWSPDGTKIAYVRRDANTGSSVGIYVINAGGPAGVGTLLINGNANRPSWSPDGSEIAYGNYPINVAYASTGGFKRSLGDGYDPCWSPDGTKITFGASGESGASIWVMNAADGSNRQQLSDPPYGYEDDEPNWSPDGTKIVFMRLSEGVFSSIWVMDADGTNEQELTPTMPHARDPDYQTWFTPPPPPSGAPVGGIVSPISKLEILTPYFTLAALLAVASAVLIMRRRRD